MIGWRSSRRYCGRWRTSRSRRLPGRWILFRGKLFSLFAASMARRWRFILFVASMARRGQFAIFLPFIRTPAAERHTEAWLYVPCRRSAVKEPELWEFALARFLVLVLCSTQTAFHSVISVSAVHLLFLRSRDARARLLLRCSVRYCYKCRSHSLFGRAARARKQIATIPSAARPSDLRSKCSVAAPLSGRRHLLRAGSRRD